MKKMVVAFAFGAPSSIGSNRCIALIARRKAEKLSATVYAQLDVGIGSGLTVEHPDRISGTPPSTLLIARKAVQWAKRKGVRELWVSAASPHLWRCLRDLKYAIRQEKVQIEVCVCAEIERYPEEWYCPDSEQRRTRSRKQWWRREIVLRLMPMCLYKIIASWQDN